MGYQHTPPCAAQGHRADGSAATGHDVDQQRLRILRCTAKALAESLGGLRFKAGTRPWLDGLSCIAALPAAGRATPRVASD